MNKTDLLPCPFCGGDASFGTVTIRRHKNSEGDWGTYTGHFVNCIVCGSDNQGIAEGHRTPEQAGEKWNRRVTVRGAMKLSDIAFKRYEALYEQELYMEKHEAMLPSEHEKAARREVYEAVIAECSPPSVNHPEGGAELAIAIEGILERHTNDHPSGPLAIPFTQAEWREILKSLRAQPPEAGATTLHTCPGCGFPHDRNWDAESTGPQIQPEGSKP